MRDHGAPTTASMILARALEAAVTRRSLAIPRAAFRSHLNGARQDFWTVLVELLVSF